MMTTRMEFGRFLTERGLVGTGAELGVACGYFSFPLLNSWQGKLIMVDPWGPPEPKRGQENIPTEEQERRYEMVAEQASHYGDRAVIMRMKSDLASLLVPDDSLDFLYIDADHSYGGITMDLLCWWPKLKSGAICAGHDYLEGMVGGVMYGVKKAVNEFADKHGLTVHVIGEPWPSWYAVKP